MEVKYVYFLTIVYLWECGQCQKEPKAPSTLMIRLYNPEPGKNGFEITWHPMENWDKNNPIIGYRLVLWEMQKVKKQELIDGELKYVDDDAYPYPSKFTVGLPKIYEVTADNRKINIEDIQYEVWYEYSALAFTKKGEGPLSSPVGVKVIRSKIREMLLVCEKSNYYYK